MLLDLITKAFLLHRPLTPSVKTLCIGTSAVTAVSSIVVSYVFSEPHLNDLALFTPIQSALTAVILLLEHTLVGKLFIPFSRTNSEVVIM